MRWIYCGLWTMLCVSVLHPVEAATRRASRQTTSTTVAAIPETTIGARLDSALATGEDNSPLAWYDASLLTLEGKGFNDTPTTYSRLPVRAESSVTTTVWFLSKNTAGLCIRFATDSTTIGAIWTSGFKMSHMARTGSSGVDLYAHQGSEWVYCGTGKPVETTRTVATLTRTRPGVLTEYMLYLPLYDQISELKVGVAAEAFIAPLTPRKDKPIVFYGTSMTQGGCASRAGMCHTAILGRWLNRPVINLGFSGSGKSDPEMQALVADVEAAAYVLEPLPNMTVDQVRERIPAFVKTLRAKHPTTPILLVENPLYSTTATQNLALRDIFDKARKQGTKRLHYLYAEAQLSGRENGTVDGVHPTDLGFLRMASVYEPMLKIMLSGKL
ncbi:MAG: SGNH/GDSL hydrolase family protein [Candidatus Sumerlaeaceae bacterium]